MKKQYRFTINRTAAILSVSILLLLLSLHPSLNAETQAHRTIPPTREEIEKNVQRWIQEGKIPGITLVIVEAHQPVYIKGFGKANLETQTPVTPDTLFELASCSKSFTALAVLDLERQGRLNLESEISDYFPWFSVTYNGQNQNITLRQLLHHTSGFSRKTFALITPGNTPDALEQLVKQVNHSELSNIPGERFRYNSLNYDILGAIVEKVTGQPFATYMETRIFARLGLTGTFVGVENKERLPFLATGYKKGFFQARRYNPPVFASNNPAAYIISNGKDMARWLGIQLGLIETDFADLIRETHRPNFSIPPTQGLSSYGMGWFVNPYDKETVFHTGLNPTFTSYIRLHPKEKIGVAVLANCGSSYTQFIGDSVMGLLIGDHKSHPSPQTDKVDNFCSITSVVLVLYILSALTLILSRVTGIIRGKGTFRSLDRKKLGRLALALAGMIPFLYGLYLIPYAAAQMPWSLALIWAPYSVGIAVLLLLAAIGISYILYITYLVAPSKNIYRKEIALIIIFSAFSGLAGTAVIFIVTTSFFSDVGLGYLLLYFGLIYLINIGGRKIAQTKLITASNTIALDLRIGLANKILSTQFQRFEKIREGRIFTTLNDDTTVLSRSAALIIIFVTSAIMLLSGFSYMITISMPSTLIVAGVTLVIVFYYRIVAKKTRNYMEAARDAQNEYMSHLNSMVLGFKELSLHRQKKYEFKKDLIDSTRTISSKNILAGINFLNAQITGESIGLIILGVLSIVIPRLNLNVNTTMLISFVMLLLYLLEPIKNIINIVPSLIQIKVSWDRIKDFVKTIDEKGNQEVIKEFIKHIDLVEKQETIDLHVLDHLHKHVENLKVEGLMFEYEAENGNKGFSIGPINLDMNKGEALFITGGNGSGKTTIAKLITGLYLCDKGNIKINNLPVDSSQIGEYFSAIYSNYHLFKKIYGIDLDGKKSEIQSYLKTLNLDHKVQLRDGGFSTVDLSGGQKKRLALLQCWMEDHPIYLFDEVAADQDPEFRKFFYHNLLMKMKEKGKMIIAITHDDHYFNVADKIIKMDMGKIEISKTTSRTTDR